MGFARYTGIYKLGAAFDFGLVFDANNLVRFLHAFFTNLDLRININGSKCEFRYIDLLKLFTSPPRKIWHRKVSKEPLMHIGNNYIEIKLNIISGRLIVYYKLN